MTTTVQDQTILRLAEASIAEHGKTNVGYILRTWRQQEDLSDFAPGEAVAAISRVLRTISEREKTDDAQTSSDHVGFPQDNQDLDLAVLEDVAEDQALALDPVEALIAQWHSAADRQRAELIKDESTGEVDSLGRLWADLTERHAKELRQALYASRGQTSADFDIIELPKGTASYTLTYLSSSTLGNYRLVHDSLKGSLRPVDDKTVSVIRSAAKHALFLLEESDDNGDRYAAYQIRQAIGLPSEFETLVAEAIDSNWEEEFYDPEFTDAGEIVTSAAARAVLGLLTPAQIAKAEAASASTPLVNLIAKAIDDNREDYSYAPEYSKEGYILTSYAARAVLDVLARFDTL